MARPLNQHPTVGYVVSAWPRLSETFILNEVLAVERLGLRLRIFSIKDPKDGSRQSSAGACAGFLSLDAAQSEGHPAG